LHETPTAKEYLSTALDVTFQMGSVAERLLVEEWAGDYAIGNWQCRYCHDQRSIVPKPKGCCPDGRLHSWAYQQLVVTAPEYGISGGIDCLFDIGAPLLCITEIKTLNPTEFDSMVVPFPEHRLRTNLYLRILAESAHPYKSKFNLQEGRVLYISRGYGKMNAQWNELLPFREFVVKRDDADLKLMLQRAKALKLFRDGGGMPSGICATATDKIAKACGQCVTCFSGQFPATVVIEKVAV
jgi:hypothetical protein